MPRRRWGKEAGRGYEAGFIPVGMVAPCQDQECKGGLGAVHILPGEPWLLSG